MRGERGTWNVERGKGSRTYDVLDSRFSPYTSDFKRSSGFSLLELIAAMTILVIVIGILGRIVTDTQRVWRHGADRARITASARAAFAMLEEDLSAAVANSNLVFHLENDEQGSSLSFYRLMIRSEPSTNRAIRQVRYHVESNALIRTWYDLTFEETLEDQTRDPELIVDVAYTTILENLISLQLIPQWNPSDPSDQEGSLLPAWLDAEATILPERMARRFPSPGNPEDLAERYHQRFYLRNREGGRVP